MGKKLIMEKLYNLIINLDLESIKNLVKDEENILDGIIEVNNNNPIRTAYNDYKLQTIIERCKNTSLINSIHKITPFALACVLGDIDIINFMINENVDVNKISEYERKPLDYAILLYNYEVCELLLNNGANSTKLDIINHVCKSGNLDMLNLFVNYGYDINSKNIYGVFPLMVAINNKKINIVYRLIELGVDIHFLTDKKNNALIWAVNVKSLELVKLFIEKGIDIDHRTVEGYCALSVAATVGDEEITKYLLSKGAKEYIDGDKIVPILRAAHFNRIRIINLFIENGTDIHKRYGHETVLERAKKCGHTALVDLIENNMNIQD